MLQHLKNRERWVHGNSGNEINMDIVEEVVQEVRGDRETRDWWWRWLGGKGEGGGKVGADGCRCIGLGIGWRCHHAIE